MRGRVERYILESLKEKGALHMTLIDPARSEPLEARKIAREAVRAGTTAIMVGGSIGVSEWMVDEVVKAIKSAVNVPVILFPGNPSGVSKYADAVWFLSVLNSYNPFFIIGGQMQGAPIVKRYGLEALPLAYLILGEGGAVSYVSQTRPLPLNKPEIVVAYALAAQYMGFRFVYLEGGSGGIPVPPHIIKAVKENVEIPVIVGGGIRSRELATRAVASGADIIVTGTIVEEATSVYDTIRSIIEGIEEGVKLRAQGCRGARRSLITRESLP